MINMFFSLFRDSTTFQKTGALSECVFFSPFRAGLLLILCSSRMAGFFSYLVTLAPWRSNIKVFWGGNL
jgi:hypothetical protein